MSIHALPHTTDRCIEDQSIFRLGVPVAGAVPKFLLVGRRPIGVCKLLNEACGLIKRGLQVGGHQEFQSPHHLSTASTHTFCPL